MNSQRWLAGFAGVVALFLLIEGAWTAWIAEGVRHVEAGSYPFATADDVAWARSHLLGMYLVVAEGLLFGTIAAICAVALFVGRPWARRLLLMASVLLALTAMVVIAVAPQQWDTQGVFIVFCVLLWLEARKWRRA